MEFKYSYMETEFKHICEWCKENNEGAWLKSILTEKIQRPVYPTVKKINKYGKEIEVIDKKAKDSKQSIGTKEDTRSYIEVKRAFFEKFFPSKLPEKKEKKGTMADIFSEYFG